MRSSDEKELVREESWRELLMHTLSHEYF
jgi:hypothetical protein